MVNRFYKPTAKVIMANTNAKKWQKAKRLGLTKCNTEVVENYKMYTYFPETKIGNTETDIPGPDGKILRTESIITKEMVEQMNDQNQANISSGG